MVVPQILVASQAKLFPGKAGQRSDQDNKQENEPDDAHDSEALVEGFLLLRPRPQLATGDDVHDEEGQRDQEEGSDSRPLNGSEQDEEVDDDGSERVVDQPSPQESQRRYLDRETA